MCWDTNIAQSHLFQPRSKFEHPSSSIQWLPHTLNQPPLTTTLLHLAHNKTNADTVFAISAMQLNNQVSADSDYVVVA